MRAHRMADVVPFAILAPMRDELVDLASNVPHLVYVVRLALSRAEHLFSLRPGAALTHLVNLAEAAATQEVMKHIAAAKENALRVPD